MDPWEGECNAEQRWAQLSLTHQTRLFCSVVPSGASLGKGKKVKTERVEPHYVDVQKAAQAASGKGKRHRGTGRTCSSSALTQGDGSLVSEPI